MCPLSSFLGAVSLVVPSVLSVFVLLRWLLFLCLSWIMVVVPCCGGWGRPLGWVCSGKYVG